MKSIKESTFSGANSKEDVSPTKIEWYKFDRSGNKVEFVSTNSSYCPDSPDHYYRAYYQYDSSNHLIYSHFTEGGFGRGYSNYVYDRHGRLLEKDDFFSNRVPCKPTHLYTYDSNRHVKVSELAYAGYRQQFEYFYDINENLVLLEMEIFDDKRQKIYLESRVEATYDREGNIIREKGRDDIGEKENYADFTYEYSDRDTAGNWQVKTVRSYIFNRIKEVVKREIEYY